MNKISEIGSHDKFQKRMILILTQYCGLTFQEAIGLVLF